MNVLLTGADGFAGGWLVRRLLAAGHRVTGTRGPQGKPSPVLLPAEQGRIAWRDLDLDSNESVVRAVQGSWDVVFHLAALSSGSEARADPGLAWSVNAAGTARLAEAIATGRDGADPLLLLVSSGEVYGRGDGARTESDLPEPCSPYAASKLGAEVAALEVGRRTGLRVMIARAFPHTGPGQDQRFVVPALAERIRVARQLRAPAIKAGNLTAVRDFLDVRDVVAAYLLLAEQGAPGQIYNLASGTGLPISEIAERLMRSLDWKVTIESDARLMRPSDLPHLVGNPGKLRALGWTPLVPFDQTLNDLVHAQAS